ncbi:hypothetical protein OOT46_09020 [Aquabacterium sp. A7-Y]|uniref:M949_RS01915 family surface polysaccharide biosynthesis protein n=1 Tax=Aquabacterium sp. A7-Y TaxID=1349605 RepID=UPI00223D31C8|nr:hypothetical protein [Aquabacterium sp. A7-Y]MCW7537989.1 hypothetical protein [Aquabacterium sp. A7-Y]
MKKAVLSFLALLSAAWLACAAGNAQAAALPYRKLSKADLPAALKAEGKVVAAFEWSDIRGRNLAVFSQSLRRGKEGTSAGLHAFGYRVEQQALRRVWKVEDGLEDCDLDLTSFFEIDSLEVTDLDGNGIGEVSFVYRLACNGGLDLIDEKLFLVEDGKKFPVRGGTEWTGVDDNDQGGHYDGPMWVDKAYNHAPASFKPFAVAKWRRFRQPSED